MLDIRLRFMCVHIVFESTSDNKTTWGRIAESTCDRLLENYHAKRGKVSGERLGRLVREPASKPEQSRVTEPRGDFCREVMSN